MPAPLAIFGLWLASMRALPTEGGPPVEPSSKAQSDEDPEVGEVHHVKVPTSADTATARIIDAADLSVTQLELTAVDITGETRYQVGNQTDVTDLWAFIEAQSALVGHIDGEGHCDAG